MVVELLSASFIVKRVAWCGQLNGWLNIVVNFAELMATLIWCPWIRRRCVLYVKRCVWPS